MRRSIVLVGLVLGACAQPLAEPSTKSAEDPAESEAAAPVAAAGDPAARRTHGASEHMVEIACPRPPRTLADALGSVELPRAR
jgi:hypothetical protein